jgi:alkylation response protein AidB-like acyl-CoA dehydrogenase
MNFNLTQEQKMLREMVREFAKSEVKPLACKIDVDEEIPKELIRKLAEVGLLGTAFPEEYGGGGFGEVGFCIAQEEITRACGSTATMIGAHQSIGTNSIYIGGSEELKRKYLPALTSGEKIAAFVLTEPNAGSDAFSLNTTAKLEKDKWIINGSKVWITNAGICDVMAVYARTEKAGL